MVKLVKPLEASIRIILCVRSYWLQIIWNILKNFLLKDCAKNDRDERQWRIEVEQQRSLLKGKVFDGLVISAPCRCLCQGIWRFVD